MLSGKPVLIKLPECFSFEWTDDESVLQMSAGWVWKSLCGQSPPQNSHQESHRWDTAAHCHLGEIPTTTLGFMLVILSYRWNNCLTELLHLIIQVIELLQHFRDLDCCQEIGWYSVSTSIVQSNTGWNLRAVHCCQQIMLWLKRSWCWYPAAVSMPTTYRYPSQAFTYPENWSMAAHVGRIKNSHTCIPDWGQKWSARMERELLCHRV
jgi:hypothetical protein